MSAKPERKTEGRLVQGTFATIDPQKARRALELARGGAHRDRFDSEHLQETAHDLVARELLATSPVDGRFTITRAGCEQLDRWAGWRS